MFKTIGIVGGVAMAVAVVGAGLFAFTHSGSADGATELTHVHGSPYYVASERALSLDPPLNALIGGNMKFGEAVLKQSDLRGDVGTVFLDLIVSGTNGSGHARVHLAHPKHEVPWQYQGGDFFPDNGPPLHLDAR